MNGIKVTGCGTKIGSERERERELQMELFHYNTFKVCPLPLQYNPVGVGTLFFTALHVCITSVINWLRPPLALWDKSTEKTTRPMSSFTCLSVLRLRGA